VSRKTQRNAGKGPNVSGAIRSILNRDVPLPAGPMGEQIGRMLAEIAVELQDRIDEAKHWKVISEALRGEIRTLAALIIKQQRLERIVVTQKEFEAFPENQELVIEVPEPGVRIYELRTRIAPPPKDSASSLVLPGSGKLQ